MHPISDILDDLRQGRMVVLVDDEQRENEGDLVCAAEHVTPQIINFMLREARGVLCLALDGATADRLDLKPQAQANTAQRGTAFLVSIDAHEKFGITTGVSAADRAKTIQIAIADATRPDDLARPGHVNPLRARDGGVLVRAGQTEGSVDLCRLAGLKSAAVIIEIMNDDGSMARLPELHALCAKHDLKMCSVAHITEHRTQRQKLVERIAEAPFETEHGMFHLIAYRSYVDPLPHVALVAGDLGAYDAAGEPVDVDQPVLVRMHSQNLLGDVFGDVAQPTGRALSTSMRMIQDAGRGAIVYLRHEMAGTGLLQRLQTLHSSHGQQHEEERVALGRGQQTPGIRPPVNKGAYGIGSQILRDLGVRKLCLLTNHPFHPTALSGFGLEITEFVKIDR